MSDSSYELTQTSPLAISPQLFHSKLKTLLFSKSYPIHRHPHTYLPVSTPNTIHHSRLTVCLPDSLDLDPCLSTAGSTHRQDKLTGNVNRQTRQSDGSFSRQTDRQTDNDVLFLLVATNRNSRQESVYFLD